MMSKNPALLVYRNGKGELRTTYIAEIDDYFADLLDKHWREQDKLDNLGYEGALSMLGTDFDDADFCQYDGFLGAGRKIPNLQPSWGALVKAVKGGDYDIECELDHVYVFDGSAWAWYPRHGVRIVNDFAELENPKGRYKVTLEVTVNALSANDANLTALTMLRDSNTINPICGVSCFDRNMTVCAKAALEVGTLVF
jgi:hypothetical protein